MLSSLHYKFFSFAMIISVAIVPPALAATTSPSTSASASATPTVTGTPSPSPSPRPSSTPSSSNPSPSPGTSVTPTPQPEVVFSDITKNHWAFDAVQTVVQAKIMNGYGDGTFRPDQPITRAETTKVVALATGKKTIEMPKAITLPFSDIKPDDALLRYIQYSYTNKIIKGYGDGTFRPGNPVTRGEFLKIFTLAASTVFKDYNTGEAFLDVGASHDLASYIYSARALGYIKGTSNGLFYPNMPITRGEAAQIIHRYLADKNQVFADLSDLEKKMLDSINVKRQAAGKPALVIDKKLSAIARKQSKDLFDQWHFLDKEQKKAYETNHSNQMEQDQQRPWTSHRNPSGLTFDQWFALASARYGIEYTEATQNIAHAFYDSSTPLDRINDIINKMFEQGSDNNYLYAHAYNLLGLYASYTHIGIGVVVGDDPEEMYVTQILTK